MKITTDTGIYFTCLSSIRNRTNLAVFSSVDASIPHFPSSSKASIDGIHVAGYLDEKIGGLAIDRLEPLEDRQNRVARYRIQRFASFINPDCRNYHG